MEVRVKSGDGIVCEYSGDECVALVKIIGPGGEETKWLGRGTLQNALSLLNSMQSIHAHAAPPEEAPVYSYPVLAQSAPLPVPVQEATAAVAEAHQVLSQLVQPPPPYFPPNVRFPGRDAKDPKELVNQFELALVDLVENPPQTGDNEPDGRLPETAIRELVMRFKPSFRNPNSMFNALRKHVGMNKERFETIIS